LLLGIADVASVAAACREAAERGLGWLVLAEPGGDDDVAMGQGAGPLAGEAGWKAGDPGLVVGEAGWKAGDPGSGPSLQLDARLVERLPALLRVYVGAASAAHGPTDRRLLLAGAVAQDPRAHRPEARSARRL
jgi:hypothetical protein